MSDEEIFILIDKELNENTVGVTEQYLEIHRPVYINEQVKIERIDRGRADGVIIAYLPVVGEDFYLAVYIDNQTRQIMNIGSEPSHRLYFYATSELLTEAQLKSMSKLIATDSRNKGDLRQNGKASYKYSSISFLPHPEPDEFEDKLIKLLDYLEQDKEGIKRLIDEANGYIQVSMVIHNANGMIGGPAINRKTMKRMGDLGLGIDFDLYVGGNPFMEDD